MISGAIGALNSLFSEVENGTKNINSLLGTLGSISSGIDKYEIERRSSLTAPLDAESAMRLVGEKRKTRRSCKELDREEKATAETVEGSVCLQRRVCYWSRAGCDDHHARRLIVR